MNSVAQAQERQALDAMAPAPPIFETRQPVLESGLAAALLANVIWGTSFLASKYTLESWGPFTASALRFLLATVLIFVSLRVAGRSIRFPKSIQEWSGVFAVALTGFGFLYPLQLSGLNRISSSLSAAIMLTSPLFVVISARLFLKDLMTARKLGGVLVGIVGGTLLLFPNLSFNFSVTPEFALGATLTLAASISLALSAIATRRLSRTMDSGNLTFWSMAVGFGLLAALAGAFETERLPSVFTSASPRSLLALLFLAAVCSAFCFFIWNFALAKASPKEIASTMHIKTPTAVIVGTLVAGETLTTPLILGTLIVAVGVWISQTSSGSTK